MIRVALKGLAARPVRTALTTLAIVIGVAFVTAAYTLTDTMSGAADSLTHAAYVAKRHHHDQPRHLPPLIAGHLEADNRHP